MLHASFIISSYIHAILQAFAPTNILLRAIRTRRGHKWGVLAMLLAIPYLLVAVWCQGMIEDGGSKWLLMVVAVCFYNAFKVLLMGPLSLCWLIRAKYREAATRRVAASETREVDELVSTF